MLYSSRRKTFFLNKVFFFVLILGAWNPLFGQQKVIYGTVVDDATNSTLPGVSITLKKDKSVGVLTDGEGKFRLKIKDNPNDSIVASLLSYKSQVIPLGDRKQQFYALSLTPASTSLKGVTISQEGNPAFRIMRKAVRNKSKNNKTNLLASEYDSYNLSEIFFQNINKSLLGKLPLLKNIEKAAIKKPSFRNSKGQVLIPVLVSEIKSHLYVRQDPFTEKEEVYGNKLSGIGLKNLSTIANYIGGKANEYNFLDNQVNVFRKYFTSPIAESWKSVYNVELSKIGIRIDSSLCYEISVRPKVKTALAFSGTIWITEKDYALKKVDVILDSSTNINLLKSFHIVQVMERIKQGAWVDSLTEVTAEIVVPGKIIPSTTLYFKTLNEHYQASKLKPIEFYYNNDSINLKAQNQVNWDNVSHNDSLSLDQKDLYSFIDSIKRNPFLRTSTYIVKTINYGYIESHIIDFGPNPNFYSWNDIEGNRPGFGIRTNNEFSRSLQINAQLAYGFKDEKFKYAAGASYNFKGANPTKIGLSRSVDILPIQFIADNLTIYKIDNANYFEYLKAVKKLITLRSTDPFYIEQNKIFLERRIVPGLKEKIELSTQKLNAAYPFAYTTQNNTLSDEIKSAEISFETTFYKEGRVLQLPGGNQVNLKTTSKFPVFSLWANFGFKGLLGSSFNYQKLIFNISQRNIPLLGLGQSDIFFNASYIFSALPYPLLRSHPGNESFVFSDHGFNLMNNLEFVSDHFISLNFKHYFDSPFFTTLPIFRQIYSLGGLRVVGSFAILYGGIREENKKLIALKDLQGNPTVPVRFLEFNKPYIEGGMALGNILKVFSIGYYRRFSYLDFPLTPKSAIKLDYRFSL